MIDLLIKYAPVFASGASLTLYITVWTILLTFPLGFAGALIRVFGLRPLRVAVAAYVEVTRNVPLLVVLYFFYFGLAAAGLRLSGLVSGILALTLSSTAYTIEIFRGGLAGISASQYLAATSLGLRPLQIFRHIILPQVVALSSPALGNQVVVVLLGSSLAATIGVAELTYNSLELGGETFRYFEVFAIAAIIYALAAQVFGLSWRAATHQLLRTSRV